MEGGGNSSDSGSGGIIDVSNMSSSFNAPPSLHASGHTSDEDKRNAGSSRHPCPHSVEKVWFTDTTTGVWLLNEEQADCEIPDEYLDVSLESEEELNDENSNDEEDECRSKVNTSNAGETDTSPAVEQPQLCVWVPSQCCLIPLPESPAGSDHEGGWEEVGAELSEEQRQHEKELQVLFGYKPPSACDPASSAAVQVEGEKEGWEDGTEGGVFVNGVDDKEKVLVAARGNKRCNSTDSGVASISPHSTEDDLEQRHNRNRTEAAVAMEDITEQVTPTHGDTPPPETGGESHSLPGLISTPERPSKQTRLPVSRLKTPSEKLRKCSVFIGSPVICSELEELKEASRMAPPFPPLPPPPTSSSNHDTPNFRNQTHTITPPTYSSSLQPEGEVSEKSSDSVSVSSVTSGCSSVGSRETNEHVQTVKNGKKPVNTNKARGTCAFKAGTNVPQVKGLKKPPLKLKTLLPVSGTGRPSALPSQIKKPEIKRRGSDDKPHPPPHPPSAVGGGQLRKTATGTVRSSRLVPPGQRKLSDNGPKIVQKSLQNKTFAKPAPIKDVSKPAGTASRDDATRGTPIRVRAAVNSKFVVPSHSTTPSRAMGNAKQPQNNVRSRRCTTASVAPPTVDQTVKTVSDNTSILSTSIVSTFSSFVQQSTPMKQVSHTSSAVPTTVVKAVKRTVTKDSCALAASQRDEDAAAIPVTPRSSVVGSTPSRRVRPKFSLSSIDSDSGSTCQPSGAAAGNTFTVDTDQPAAETPRIRKNRRSFIPTPIRPESREAIPLLYSSNSKSTQQQAQQDSPVSRKPPDSGTAAKGEKRKTSIRARRPLVSRNRLTAGLGKKQPQKGPDGPLKPMNTYKYSYNIRNLGENAEPPVCAAKMVHSPINNDDKAESPHSAWSPIRRNPVIEGEACFQCTKRGYRN